MARHQLRAHFIFLVHGFMGNPDELSYFEEAIENAAIETREPDDEAANVVAHRVECNNGKTFDGIEAGGERVAREVRTFVGDHAAGYREKDGKKTANNGGGDGRFHAGISFVGYSLGGMYARYALSTLPMEFDGVVLHPLHFVSAATPHLGMASHSYVKLPRGVECMLGRCLGRTGRDLFRIRRRGERRKDGTRTPHGDLVCRMATDAKFLDPLSAFRRRVAYANAFASDFAVPAATAGMLDSRSASRHYLCSDCALWDREAVGFEAYAFRTKSRDRPRGLQPSGTGSREYDEALTMSLSMDSLGWTKVFVDPRDGMSGPSVRRVWRRPRRDLMTDAISDKKEAAASEGDGDDDGVSFESRELRDLVRSSERLHVAPSGHFLLVAHSKTKRGAKKYARGRPLVDLVASDLVKGCRENVKEWARDDEREVMIQPGRSNDCENTNI